MCVVNVNSVLADTSGGTISDSKIVESIYKYDDFTSRDAIIENASSANNSYDAAWKCATKYDTEQEVSADYGDTTRKMKMKNNGLKDAAYTFDDYTYSAKNSVKMSNGYYLTLTISANETVVFDCAGDSSDRTFTINNGTENVGSISIPKNTIAQYEVKFLEKGTYTFTSNGQFFLCAVGIISGIPTSNKYTWQLGTTPSGLTFADGELTFENDKTDTLSNTLNYSGRNYTPESIALDENTAGVVPTQGTSLGQGADGTTYYNYTVTVNIQDGWFTEKQKVNVTKVEVTGETNVNLGYATTLAATVTPTDATNPNVTWSTNATNVVLSATEGNEIKVRGTSEGEAVITATADGVQENITINVIKQTAGSIDAVGSYSLSNQAKSIGFGTDKEFIANGTVILDKFTVYDTNADITNNGEVNHPCIRTNPFIQTGCQEKGYIEFTTTQEFKLTVPFASTGNGNVSVLVILDESNNIVASKEVTGTTAVDLVINNLSAGTYKIASPTVEHGGVTGTSDDVEVKKTYSADRGARLTTVTFATPSNGVVQSSTDAENAVAVYNSAEKTYYAVSVIKADNAKNYSSLSLKYGENDIAGTTTTKVYKSVKFDDSATAYTAVDFGGTSDDYVYAYEVNVGSSTDEDSTIATKVKAITMSLQ